MTGQDSMIIAIRMAMFSKVDGFSRRWRRSKLRPPNPNKFLSFRTEGKLWVGCPQNDVVELQCYNLSRLHTNPWELHDELAKYCLLYKLFESSPLSLLHETMDTNHFAQVMKTKTRYRADTSLGVVLAAGLARA